MNVITGDNAIGTTVNEGSSLGRVSVGRGVVKGVYVDVIIPMIVACNSGLLMLFIMYCVEFLEVRRQIMTDHFIGRAFSWRTVEFRKWSNQRRSKNSFGGEYPLFLFGTFRDVAPYSCRSCDGGILFPIGWYCRVVTPN